MYAKGIPIIHRKNGWYFLKKPVLSVQCNIYIIIIISNNQPTDKGQRPVGCITMKTGLCSFTSLVYMESSSSDPAWLLLRFSVCARKA